MLIIVPEGEVTEVEYFGHLKTFTSRLHIQVERCRGNSPRQLKKRLASLMKRACAEKEGVTGWVVLDRDRWDEKEVQSVFDWQEKERDVHIAMTNPQFEWWLALHFEAAPRLERLRAVLMKHDALQGTNKKGVNARVFDAPSIWKAIERAATRRSALRIPGPRETDVHLLARQIMTESMDEG